MNFLDIAKDRYATKQYNPNEKITDETLQQLKEILRLSPSSINSQPWKFTVVADADTKSKFAAVSSTNEAKINQASHLIVFNVMDDIEKFEHTHLQQLPERAGNYYYQYIKPLGEAGIKNWFQHQVYLSLGFFLAACANMEIDSTPMEGIQTSEYDKILQYEGYKTLFAVVIGRRNETDANQPALKPKFRRPLEDIVDII